MNGAPVWKIQMQEVHVQPGSDILISSTCHELLLAFKGDANKSVYVKCNFVKVSK